jgi:uracil-DNA glycosylase
MGIRADIEADYHAALAALAWQVDLGADEAICEAPVSAYDLPEKAEYLQRAASVAVAAVAPAAPRTAPAAAKSGGAEAILAASQTAAACQSREALDSAAAAFELCDLRKGARGAVAAIGHAQADVLVICDPPSTEGERAGRALMGDDSVLFEKIFSAIGLALDAPSPAGALQLAPALPWPLRGGDAQKAEALAMMRPFALRRIELAAPKAVVIMGHIALEMLLGETSLTRARGSWASIAGLRALVMWPPHVLLQNPSAKRDTWADALALKAMLRG